MSWIGSGSRRTKVCFHGAVRALTSALLCSLLVETPIFAELPPPSPKDPTDTRPGQLQGEQRILHALNRLTFGPRPGEVAEVDRIGLKRWFEMQLNPQTIDDSALNTRLSAYPAMFLPQAELIERYPSPQRLRKIIDQEEPLPRDPVEHAIYADNIALYQDAKARRSAVAQAALTPRSAAPSPKSGQDLTGKTPLKQASEAPLADTADPELAESGPARPGVAKPDMAKPDVGNLETNKPAVNRGRARHDESAFPEAATVEILALPPDARVRRVLDLQPEELIAFRRSLSQAELAGLTHDLSPQQKEIFGALGGAERMVGAEVLESRLERDVYSRRELEAVMTDFWLNHFNVYLRKNQNEPYLLPAYERETIRPHALGRFEDLLVATARSPAMLLYLDNWQSIGPDSQAAQRGPRKPGIARIAAIKQPAIKQPPKDRGLNENYARELMELHTVGVGCEVSTDHPATELDPACGKGYTQADVTEVAKVFSGWTIDRPAQSGEYRFEERRHQPGQKLVLGQTIPEGGEREGLEVLHRLATSPATARFLSTKLAIRFVSDTPPPALVDRMSKSYLATGGDIRSVLRTMFDSPEFWSPSVFRAKVKTPLEFVTSALRSTGADITNAVPVVQALDRLGMPLYGMQTPNGYSWKSDPWISTGGLVSRLNFALVLSSDRLPGTRTDLFNLLADRRGAAEPVAAAIVSTADDAGALISQEQLQEQLQEQRLEHLLLVTPASARTRQTVLAQARDTAVPRQAEIAFLHGAVGAAAGNPARPSAPAPSPDRQAPSPDRQAATMAGLLLGSPEFQRR